jgi:F0F1-type ATP synthase assembly protein I
VTGERGMTADKPRQPPDGGVNIGWTIFGYLISGMLVYGGLGWLIGHWTGHPLIFPLGMLAGLAFSVWLVIYRYGRS